MEGLLEQVRTGVAGAAGHSDGRFHRLRLDLIRGGGRELWQVKRRACFLPQEGRLPTNPSSCFCEQLLESAAAGEAPDGGFSLADAASDYAWEVLHTGHWKDVAMWWRSGYSLAQLLKALLRSGEGRLAEALRFLDLAALMGGTLFRPEIDPLAESLVDRLRRPDESPPPEPDAKRPRHNALASGGRLPAGSLADPVHRVPALHLPSLEEFLHG